MTPENIVASKDLCQKLYGMGVRLDTVFEWVFLRGQHKDTPFGRVDQEPYWVIWEKEDEGYVKPTRKFSAPTAGELGEALPPLYTTYRNELGRWLPEELVEEGTEMCAELGGYDTEANARAAMLIYLLEHGILKAEKI